MRNKRLLFFILILMLLLLTACGKKEETVKKTDDSIHLYFSDEAGTSLVSKNHKKSAKEDPQEQAIEIIGWLRNKNLLDKDQFLSIPSEVAINNVTVNKHILFIDFAVGYEQISKEKELLCRASIVYTLLQIKGIDYVEFSIGGTTMMDTDGTPIGSLTKDSFLFGAISMENENKY